MSQWLLRDGPLDLIASRAHPSLTIIVGIDFFLSMVPVSRVIVGPLDELAHILTTGLLLAPWRARFSPGFVAGALVGSFLLDVDHIPRALKPTIIRHRTRPAPHSLSTVMGVVLASALAPPTSQAVLRGTAVGVACHLVRDIGTGTAPLAWPMQRRGAGIPYLAYVSTVIAMAGPLSRRWDLGGITARQNPTGP